MFERLGEMHTIGRPTFWNIYAWKYNIKSRCNFNPFLSFLQLKIAVPFSSSSSWNITIKFSFQLKKIIFPMYFHFQAFKWRKQFLEQHTINTRLDLGKYVRKYILKWIYLVQHKLKKTKSDTDRNALRMLHNLNEKCLDNWNGLWLRWICDDTQYTVFVVYVVTSWHKEKFGSLYTLCKWYHLLNELTVLILLIFSSMLCCSLYSVHICSKSIYSIIPLNSAWSRFPVLYMHTFA